MLLELAEMTVVSSGRLFFDDTIQIPRWSPIPFDLQDCLLPSFFRFCSAIFNEVLIFIVDLFVCFGLLTNRNEFIKFLLNRIV